MKRPAYRGRVLVSLNREDEGMLDFLRGLPGLDYCDGRPSMMFREIVRRYAKERGFEPKYGAQDDGS